MGYYFPTSLWKQVMSDELSDCGRCAHLVDFLAKLGMRNPSEQTLQLLTSILLHLPNSALPKASPDALHQSFLQIKQLVRKHLAAQGPVPATLSWIEVLPQTWQQLDQRWLLLVFESESPAADVPLNLTTVAVAATTIPMRSTNKMLRGSKPMNALYDGDVVAQLLQRLAGQSAMLPGFKLLGSAACGLADAPKSGSALHLPVEQQPIAKPMEAHEPRAPSLLALENNSSRTEAVSAPEGKPTTPVSAAAMLKSELANALESTSKEEAADDSSTSLKGKKKNDAAKSKSSKKKDRRSLRNPHQRRQ